MRRRRRVGWLLPIGAVATVSACAGPVPKAFVSASHETIVTALPQSGAATQSAEQRTLDLARQFVFRVRNTDCALLGTAFFAKGYLFTNRHVAAGAASLELSTWAGEDFNASVLGHSGAFDLARTTARVPADVTPASIGSDPSVGESVYVAGYPQGNQLTVTSGDVIATLPGTRVGMVGPILLVSDPVKPGNSGSPLLDPGGKVVGVVFAEDVHTHDGLVIPVSDLDAFARSLPVTARLSCADTRAPAASGSST